MSRKVGDIGYTLSSNGEGILIWEQWCWLMDYCKREGIPPAQAWAWEMALIAYSNYIV